MQFYGALILMVTLSAACALRCYSCSGASCTDEITCQSSSSVPHDRCATNTVRGVVTKTCQNNQLCVSPIQCCSSDLCNSDATKVSSVLLLLVSSAIITIFF